MLSEIREVVELNKKGKLNSSKTTELVYSTLESSIDGYCTMKGWENSKTTSVFNSRLPREELDHEIRLDLEDLVGDEILSKLNTLLGNGRWFDKQCTYSVLSSGDLLIGIDKDDLRENRDG